MCRNFSPNFKTFVFLDKGHWTSNIKCVCIRLIYCGGTQDFAHINFYSVLFLSVYIESIYYGLNCISQTKCQS